MEQTQEIPPITNRRLAYRIGFSDSLDRRSYSPYKDIMKWPLLDKAVKKFYYRGYEDGLRIRKEVLDERTQSLYK